MKRNSLIVFGIALTLAACSGEQKIVRTMEIRSSDSSKVRTILQATEKVMERRFASLQLKNAHVSVVPLSTNTALLTLTLPDKALAEKFDAILSSPFTFDIRIENLKEKLKKDDPDESEWTPTALTGSSLSWVQAVGNKNTGKVSLELQFTEEGQSLLQSLFQENVGKNIGIFVRDAMMSTFSITRPDVGSSIMIGGVPSASIAEVFSDDVNVGLLVRFANP